MAQPIVWLKPATSERRLRIYCARRADRSYLNGERTAKAVVVVVPGE
jgi:hypothetical protein